MLSFEAGAIAAHARSTDVWLQAATGEPRHPLATAEVQFVLYNRGCDATATLTCSNTAVATLVSANAVSR